jgi:hypothetical protein
MAVRTREQRTTGRTSRASMVAKLARTVKAFLGRYWRRRIDPQRRAMLAFMPVCPAHSRWTVPRAHVRRREQGDGVFPLSQ